jgi:hypothetical protein
VRAGRPRSQQFAVVVEADETPVEQVIRTRGQQQPIGALQTLFVGALAPGFDVTTNQVSRVVDEGDPAGPLDPSHPFLEATLADPGLDQRRPCGVGKIGVGDPSLLDILPFLDARELTLDH